MVLLRIDNEPGQTGWQLLSFVSAMLSVAIVQ